MHPADDPTADRFPALAPSAATLGQRLQGTVQVLREVVREGSAAYWYERGKTENAAGQWPAAEYSLNRCLALENSHWRGALQLLAARAGQLQACEQAIIQAFSVLPAIESHQQELSLRHWDNLKNLLLGSYKPTRYYDLADILHLKRVFSLAVICWITGQYEEAHEYFSEACLGAHHPENDHRHLIYRLSGLLKLAANGDAVDDFSFSKLGQQHNSVDYYYLGLAKYHQAYYPLADVLQHFEQALALSPGSAAYHLGRGLVNESLLEYAAALRDYSSASALARDNNLPLTAEDAFACQVRLHEKTGDQERAHSSCDELTKWSVSNNSVSGLEEATLLYEGMGSYAQALATCNQLLAWEANSKHWQRYRYGLLAKIQAEDEDKIIDAR